MYFRVDLHDLQAFAEDANLDIYVIIDTGTPSAGEYALPDDVDTGTDMRWEAVVAVYGRNNGRVYIDTNRSNNSTAIGQNLAGFGVIARDQTAANGFLQSHFDSQLDAVEFSISRQALLDAGWNGLNAAQLNYQVFTTKDGTGNSPVGLGDIGGRSDIRDSIYDDWIASDYWKDQSNISGNKSVLKTWFGKNASNDRGKRAKVITLIHGNHPIKPGSEMQKLINNDAGAGYYRPLDVHQAYSVPASFHITPLLASGIQWAKTSPAVNKPLRDGPSLNGRIRSLLASNTVALLGTTFSDHILPYFDKPYNSNNVALAQSFLTGMYSNPPSTAVFWTPERVVDADVLDKVADLGATHTFVDQMRHITKWFGRTSALGNDGYRINQVNGVNCFVINDQASTYRFQNHDYGLSLPLRALLSRKARSGQQDQVITIFSNWDDFTAKSQADAYDINIRWLASRPWIQVVTPQQIAAGEVDLSQPPDGMGDTWGVVNRGTHPSLQKVAHDWIDHATQENYDNWYVGSANEEGLQNKLFSIRTGVPLTTNFGMQVIGSGLIGEAWRSVTNVTHTGLAPLAQASLHAAAFVTAFHNQSNNDLSKFSTGAYINPDNDYNTLADFAKFTQAQARHAAVYHRVALWAANPPAGTLKSQEDVDLDGEVEALLCNDRLFAVFERIGGRLTAAWTRDINSGAVVQVIGNPVGYANSETEAEGEISVTDSNVVAHRTSAFRDQFAAGPDTTQYVNDLYTIQNDGPNGWRLKSSDNRIMKLITLAPGSDVLEASYELTGTVTNLFVRHGLSPDLRDLLINGQASLAGPFVNAGKVIVANSNTLAIATISLNISDTGSHSNTQFNASATDVGPTNIYHTVAMRNLAQTQQIELEGTGLHFSFAMQLGVTDCTGDNDGDGLSNCLEITLGSNPNNADTDGDGMTDGFEYLHFGSPTAGVAGNDDDGDGQSNLSESVAGTNPTDPNSALRVISITPQPNGDVLVTWTSEPNKNYEVQTTTDLAIPFEPEPGHVPSAGATTSYSDPVPGSPAKHYRIRVVPPQP